MISNILKIYHLMLIFRNVTKTVFQELAQKLNTASEYLCLLSPPTNPPYLLPREMDAIK